MVKPRKNPDGDLALEDSESPFSEPVVVPLEDFIDLHSFAPGDIASVVAEYLAQCIDADFSEVRIIHGKGKGVQRDIVRSLIEKHPAVASFHEAPIEAGGWGATLVVLRKAN
jgi:DNA-nicking Smr family endonuclease